MPTTSNEISAIPNPMKATAAQARLDFRVKNGVISTATMVAMIQSSAAKGRRSVQGG